MKIGLIIFLLSSLCSCHQGAGKKTMENKKQMHYPTTGTLVKFDSSLDSIILPDTKAEIIASGYEWSEGPIWLASEQKLLFSDVPTNTIYQWTEPEGALVYLQPSGYTGKEPSICREPGSNGLTLDPEGRLVLCQHGDRQMGRMEAPLHQPQPVYKALATQYQGKRFSSPNDCVYHPNGDLYFTDPPYGLQTQDDTDPKKELPFNGVYRLKKDGQVDLIINSITRPNGLAFFPGTDQLLVACSDPAKPDWYLIDLVSDSMMAISLFYSASEEIKTMQKGLPDGLKINRKGIVFATGPGGLYIFDPYGNKLGHYQLEAPASNCALSPDEKTIYITNNMQVLRLRLQ